MRLQVWNSRIFLRDLTIPDPFLCSLLELEKYGDNQFGSAPSAAKAIPSERLNFGKLEKSYLSYKQTYSTLVQERAKPAQQFHETLSCYKDLKYALFDAPYYDLQCFHYVFLCCSTGESNETPCWRQFWKFLNLVGKAVGVTIRSMMGALRTMATVALHH